MISVLTYKIDSYDMIVEFNAQNQYLKPSPVNDPVSAPTNSYCFYRTTFWCTNDKSDNCRFFVLFLGVEKIVNLIRVYAITKQHSIF